MLKHALFYLVAVGLPLAGIFQILEIGSTAKASPFLEGTWSLIEPACLGSDLTVHEQSGRYLGVRGHAAQINAQGALEVEWQLPAGPCEGQSAKLVLLPDDAHSELRGQMTFLGETRCQSCTSTTVLATTVFARRTASDPSTR